MRQESDELSDELLPNQSSPVLRVDVLGCLLVFGINLPIGNPDWDGAVAAC